MQIINDVVYISVANSLRF